MQVETVSLPLCPIRPLVLGDGRVPSSVPSNLEERASGCSPWFLLLHTGPSSFPQWSWPTYLD